tara:strand:+ start:23 stop:583 length:561 start_codon:yes stop_codon:yes gene_type:complete
MLIHRIILKISTYFYKNILKADSGFRCGRFLNFKGSSNFVIGKNVRFGNYGTLHAINKYKKQNFNPLIEIYDNVSIGDNFHISIINKLTIKKGVLMGFCVTIVDNSHGIVNDIFEDDTLEPAERKLYSKGPVLIGKNVWIGDKVTILPGVIIGDNCIVGFNSTVTKSFPKNSLIAGNPAKIISVKK